MVRTRRGGCPHPPSRAELGFRSAGVSPAIRTRTAGGGCPYVASAPRHFVLVLFKIFFAPFAQAHANPLDRRNPRGAPGLSPHSSNALEKSAPSSTSASVPAFRPAL